MFTTGYHVFWPTEEVFGGLVPLPGGLYRQGWQCSSRRGGGAENLSGVMEWFLCVYVLAVLFSGYRGCYWVAYVRGIWCFSSGMKMIPEWVGLCRSKWRRIIWLRGSQRGGPQARRGRSRCLWEISRGRECWVKSIQKLCFSCLIFQELQRNALKPSQQHPFETPGCCYFFPFFFFWGGGGRGC